MDFWFWNSMLQSWSSKPNLRFSFFLQSSAWLVFRIIDTWLSFPFFSLSPAFSFHILSLVFEQNFNFNQVQSLPLFYTIQTIRTIQNQNNGRNHSIMPCLGPRPGRAHRRLLGQLGQRILLSGGALQRQRVIAPLPDSRDLPLIPRGRQEPFPSSLVIFV